jgi:type IV secretion system protein VirB6
MSNKLLAILKTILLLCLLAGVTSCAFSTCVDADDFGFTKTGVSSQANDQQKIFGEKEDQYIQWLSTGMVADGKRIVIVVRNVDPANHYNSYWTSWFGTPGDGRIPEFISLETWPEKTCVFNGQSYAARNMGFNKALTCPNPKARYAPVQNPPCLFTKGVGLYGLVTDPTNLTSPNTDQPTILDPTAFIDATTFHLGVTTNLLDHYESAGGYNGKPPAGMLSGGQLYFKILDRYYEDNAGQYNILIKSGFKTADAGVFAELIDMVDGMLTKATKKIYQTMVDPTKTELVKYVRLLVTVYIMISAIAFMFGLVELSHKEFILHLVKIAFMMALISPQSFDFFNNYFFVFFQDGVTEVINLMGQYQMGTEANIGSANTKMTMFDDLVHDFISGETIKKLLSLPTSSGFVGFVVMCLVFVLIVVYVINIVKAVILFLLSKIAIAILIILAPVFIPFVLFKFTRGLYDNWLKQLISYALQPVIVIAGLLLVNHMVIEQFHQMLGYRVCVEKILPPFELYRWTPQINWGAGPQAMPVPFDFDPKNSSVNGGKRCQAYECVDGKRYEDLPYLKAATDNVMLNDQVAINKIYNGEFVTFTDALKFLILIWLFVKFNDLIPKIARDLAGAGVTAPELQGAAEGAYQGAKGMVGAVGNLAYNVTDRASKGKLSAGVKKVKRTANKLYGQTVGKLDKKLGDGKGEFRGKKLFDETSRAVSSASKARAAKKAEAAKNRGLLSRFLHACVDIPVAIVKKTVSVAARATIKIATAPLTVGKAVYDAQTGKAAAKAAEANVGHKNFLEKQLEKSERGKQAVAMFGAVKVRAAQMYLKADAFLHDPFGAAEEELNKKLFGDKTRQEKADQKRAEAKELQDEIDAQSFREYVLGKKTAEDKQKQDANQTPAPALAPDPNVNANLEPTTLPHTQPDPTHSPHGPIVNPNPTLGQQPPRPPSGVKRGGGNKD